MAYPGAIGIDLGTTYSCVAVSRQGRVDVIGDDDGNRKAPGYLAFKVTEPLSQLPAPTPVTPEEMLAKTKQSAERFLGQQVTRCVLTVPAHFTDSQREAAQGAAAAAGMEVLDTIAEPVAAAIACGLREKAGTRNALVFDLGGGACAATVLAAGGGECTVQATARGPHLSGEGLDGLLVGHFAKEFRQRHRADIADNQRALRRLRVECELAKRTLSKQQLASLSIEALFDGIDLRSSISRARWEDLCGDRLRTCVATVKQALAQAGVEARNVDDVILIGGGTRIPKIRALLAPLFAGKELRQPVNPDEAVAEGAAVEGAARTCASGAAAPRTPPAAPREAVTRDEAERQLREFMPPRADAASKEEKDRRIRALGECFRRVSWSFHTDQGAGRGDFQHLLEVRDQVAEALALWQVKRVYVPDAPRSPPTKPEVRPAECRAPHRVDGAWKVERLLADALDPAATAVVIHKRAGGADCLSCRGGKARQSERCAAWGCDGRRRVPVTQCLWMPPLSMPRPDGALMECRYFDRKPWDDTHAAPKDGQPTQFRVSILLTGPDGAAECGGWRYDAADGGRLRTTAEVPLFSALLGGEVRLALPRGGEVVGEWGAATQSRGEFVFPPGALRTAAGNALEVETVVCVQAPVAARAHGAAVAPLPEPTVREAKARFDAGASLREVLEAMAGSAQRRETAMADAAQRREAAMADDAQRREAAMADDAQRRVDTVRASGDATAARLRKELAAQTAAAQRAIEQMQQTHQLESAAARKKLDEQTAETIAARMENKQLQQMRMTECATARREIEQLQQKLDAQTAETTAARKEIAQLQQMRMTESATARRQIEQLQGTLEVESATAREEIGGLQASLQEARGQCARLQRQLDQQTDRCTELLANVADEQIKLRQQTELTHRVKHGYQQRQENQLRELITVWQEHGRLEVAGLRAAELLRVEQGRAATAEAATHDERERHSQTRLVLEEESKLVACAEADAAAKAETIAHLRATVAEAEATVDEERRLRAELQVRCDALEQRLAAREEELADAAAEARQVPGLRRELQRATAGVAAEATRADDAARWREDAERAARSAQGATAAARAEAEWAEARCAVLRDAAAERDDVLLAAARAEAAELRRAAEDAEHRAAESAAEEEKQREACAEAGRRAAASATALSDAQRVVALERAAAVHEHRDAVKNEVEIERSTEQRHKAELAEERQRLREEMSQELKEMKAEMAKKMMKAMVSTFHSQVMSIDDELAAVPTPPPTPPSSPDAGRQLPAGQLCGSQPGTDALPRVRLTVTPQWPG